MTPEMNFKERVGLFIAKLGLQVGDMLNAQRQEYIGIRALEDSQSWEKVNAQR